MIIPVKKLTVLTLKDFEEEIISTIGKLGAVELKKLTEGEIIGFRETTSEEANYYMELWDRFRNLFEKVCPNGCPNMKIYTKSITNKIPYNQLEAKLKPYEMTLLSLLNKINEKKKYLETLEDAEPILKLLIENEINPAGIGEFKHIFARLGYITEEAIPKIQETFKGYEKIFYKIMKVETSEEKEEKIILYIGGLIDFKYDIDKFLEKIGFKEIKLPRNIPEQSSEVLNWLKTEKENVKNEIDELTEKFENEKKKFLEEADYLRKAILISYKIASAQNNLLRTKNMTVISGWVPEDKIPALNKYFNELREKTGNKLIVTYSEPVSEEEVPTVFKNPKVFRAYESLIRQYGIPDPREVDPTILAGLLWSIMFGYMFPDWGEGIVIILMGVYFLKTSKKDIMGIPLKSVGRLLIWAGISAVIFGLLTGSFFLIEGFPFEPLWPGLRPGWLSSEDAAFVIIWLLKIAIYFGLAEITIGMLLSIYVNLKNGHVIEALLGEHDLAGLIGFWSLAILGFEFMGAMAAKDHNFTIIPKTNFIPFEISIPGLGSSPLTWIPAITLVLSLVAIFMKSKIEGEGAIIGGSMVFESFLSFLTNLLSFARLAGFAISHVAFSVVIEMLAHALGLWGGIFALIALNAFALTLELIVVMIQALRLTFYEFLTKFYKGTGIPFKPFKIPL